MLIQQKLGHIDAIDPGDRTIDWLPLEWFETSKRIMRKRTQSGQEIALKFLAENPQLTQGDVLYEDAQTLIVVEVLPCDVLVIRPKSMYEMASVCYEIGNKHLPLFFDDNTLLAPYDAPLFRLLTALGYVVEQQQRKLVQPLKTTISPHGHASSSESLFSKILKLTTPSA
ncbi:urease accessory protein UreE [Spirosoma endbachense]|uniref:Urease accessory protein UreE n=1 Tax=Spirosoma endbachense TaxID=2666025 RepID=A0A6P1VMA3_9BACT|nr:urease accessory protein UreE [Spirosoma endbachense]QHV94203.1 urease accessory protein UreE [Spirosoma endbachense]